MELVLPNNYVEIQEEEMMYLDGGGYWTHRGNAEWSFTLSTAECGRIGAVAAAGSTLAAAIAKIPPLVPYAGTIAALAGVTSAVFSYAAACNGFRIYFHTMPWGRTPRWAQVI